MTCITRNVYFAELPFASPTNFFVAHLNIFHWHIYLPTSAGLCASRDGFLCGASRLVIPARQTRVLTLMPSSTKGAKRPMEFRAVANMKYGIVGSMTLHIAFFSYYAGGICGRDSSPFVNVTADGA